MAITHRQSLQAQGSTNNRTLAFTAGAVNNLIVVFVGTANVAADQTLSVSDTQGNTWTPCNTYTRNASAGGGDGRSFYCLAKNTTASTITATASTGVNSFMNILLDEFVGCATVSPLDVHQENKGSGTVTSNATGALAGQNEVVWGAANDSITAVGSGFTKGADDTQTDWTEWKVLTTVTTAQTATFTGSGQFVCFVAVFKPAGGTQFTQSFTASMATFSGALARLVKKVLSAA